MKPNKEQIAAALVALAAVADAIQSLGTVPNGVLYARVMKDVDLPAYEKIIDILKGCNLITEENHTLKWTGPKLEPKTVSNEVVVKFNTRADAEYWFKQERRGGNFTMISQDETPDRDGNWIVRIVRPAKEASCK